MITKPLASLVYAQGPSHTSASQLNPSQLTGLEFMPGLLSSKGAMLSLTLLNRSINLTKRSWLCGKTKEERQ